MSDIRLEQYTEKCLAVFGNTEPYKEHLLSLGGKYNAHLRGLPGWIFVNSARQKIEDFISLTKTGTTPVVSKPVARKQYSQDDFDMLVKRVEELEKRLNSSAPQMVAPVVRATVKTSAVDTQDDEEKPKRLLRKK